MIKGEGVIWDHRRSNVVAATWSKYNIVYDKHIMEGFPKREPYDFTAAHLGRYWMVMRKRKLLARNSYTGEACGRKLGRVMA